MANSERISVFVDGSNFYFGASRILTTNPKNSTRLPIRFDYGGFAKWLAGGRVITQKRYYVGLVRRDPLHRDHRTEGMVRNQQRLFAWLQLPTQGFEVVRGHLMKYPNNVYHEKGVDVRLALDLAEGAFEKRFDTAILVSSDTDLIPALQRVRKHGKKVEYIGFADQPSFGLQKFANLSKLVTRQELIQYMPTTLL
ncbi:MAG: NYN domain-containing protein [Candidatus Kerfeldbacteria bacterium]|nr:NYN domain-containing protein [Candidatus Kerfeldbacteria bacterium]